MEMSPFNMHDRHKENENALFNVENGLIKIETSTSNQKYFLY